MIGVPRHVADVVRAKLLESGEGAVMDGRSFGDHRIDDDLKGGGRPGDEQGLVEVDNDGVGRAHIELGGGRQSRETGCTYREGKMKLDARGQWALL